MAEPALVALGHGSRDPRAAETTEALLDLVRQRLPGVEVRAACLDHCAPTLADTVAGLAGEVVVVPLLLSTGFHVKADVPAVVAAVERADLRVTLGRPLGGDAQLLSVLESRFGDADGRVLVATGSADAAANAEVVAVAAELRAEVAFVTTEPRVADVVAGLRAGGARRVAVVPYLLAPGRMLDAVEAAAADDVAPVIGASPELADLVARRYREAAG